MQLQKPSSVSRSAFQGLDDNLTRDLEGAVDRLRQARSGLSQAAQDFQDALGDFRLNLRNSKAYLEDLEVYRRFAASQVRFFGVLQQSVVRLEQGDKSLITVLARKSAEEEQNLKRLAAEKRLREKSHQKQQKSWLPANDSDDFVLLFGDSE